MATIQLSTIISYWSNISTKINSVLDILTPKEASAFEQKTIPNTSTALTSATYGSSTKAYISVEGNNIRFRVDGSAPTASSGHLVSVGGLIELNSNSDIVNFKAIAVSDTSATVTCTYFS